MKKLHLHKLFHWLYAILMFLPFIGGISYVFVNFSSGNVNITLDSLVFSFVKGGLMASADELSLGYQIENVFNYLIGHILGFTDDANVLVWLSGIFTYWVSVSIVYLVFDVLMYIINVAHHWLDAGGDKL